MAQSVRLKILIVGDRGVGKSALVERLLYGPDAHEYTYAQERVRHLPINTNYGYAGLECVEISSLANADDYMDAQGAIILFDVNARSSFQNVLTWYRGILRVCRTIPIVLCGNKADGDGPRTRVKQIRLDREATLPYVELSTRQHSEDALYEPFLCILRELAGLAMATYSIAYATFGLD